MAVADGLRIPSWIAGPLIVAAMVAGASGLIVANGTAGDVEKLQQDSEKEKGKLDHQQEQISDIKERVGRIDEQTKAIKEEQKKQGDTLDEIKRAVERPR